MTVVLIKRGNLDTETGMHPGKMPYEDEGGDGVIPLQAKTCQRLPAIYRKLGGEAWNRHSLTSLRKNQPC